MAKLFRETLRDEERAAIADSRLLSALAAEEQAAAWLESILADHARVIERAPGDVITRRGDAGSLAYLLLDGALCEVRGDHAGLFSAQRGADPIVRGARSRWWRRREKSDIVVVDDRVGRRLPLDVVRAEHQTVPLSPDAPDRDVVVGAGAVLTRSQHHRTVLATEPSRLLSIHWRGLRRLAQISASFRAYADARSRMHAKRMARAQLASLPLDPPLADDALDALAEAMRFRFVGDAAGRAGVVQGAPLLDLSIVASGFGLVSRSVGGERHSIGFVSAGHFCGIAALAADGASARQPVAIDWIGEVNLLTIAASVVAEHLLPALGERHLRILDPSGHAEQQRISGRVRKLDRHADEIKLMDFLLDNALMVGRQAMVIDQHRCVGCDDCVRACADAHGGVSRFVRSGPAAGGYAVAGACMHCVEPACVVNCPTDAIFTKFTREVMLSDALCIGCGTCADACPYDNIRLVELGDAPEAKEFGTPVAVKCDLCVNDSRGPACVRACPHDAIARIDLTDYAASRLLAAREPLPRVRARLAAKSG